LSPKLSFIPDFAFDFMIDFTNLLMIDGLFGGKLLEKRDGLLDRFYPCILKINFAFNLNIIKPVKLPDFLDLFHQGVD